MVTVARVPASRMDLGAGIIKISVDPKAYIDLNRIMRGILNTDDIINSPETLASGIAPIGQRMVKNHVTGGSLVGGWKPLSAETLRIREARGYGGGRILQQSNALYSRGIVPLASWKSKQYNYQTTIPATPLQAAEGRLKEAPGLSGPTAVVATVSGKRFFAVMNGPKAENQDGGSIRYGGGFDRKYVNLPARPFWFIDQQGVDQATVLITNNFLSRWVEKMPNPVGAANRAVMGAAGVTLVSTYMSGSPTNPRVF